MLRRKLEVIVKPSLVLKDECATQHWDQKEMDEKLAQLGDVLENIIEAIFSSPLIGDANCKVLQSLDV